MFIFRIIFNLFFGVFGLFTRILWLPISLLMHNFFLILIAIIALVAWHEIKTSHIPQQTLPAVNNVLPSADNGQQLAVQLTPNTAPVVIDPVLKKEDGNSAFATDLYALMNQEERAYYSQAFFYIMNNTANGAIQPWQHGNISGSMTPTRTFNNANGEQCRTFNETLKVHTVQQTLNGIACPKGGGSWCKLKANATPSCGLGGRGAGILDRLKNLF